MNKKPEKFILEGKIPECLMGRQNTDENKQYMRDQNKCGMKRGDKVTVVRTAKDHEKGWSNAWVNEMDEGIGRELEITEISIHGIELDSIFAYPFFVLGSFKDEENNR